MSREAADNRPRDIVVWDWATRTFHWGLVVALVALYVTGKIGGNAMEWHQRIGYVVLGLVSFRIAWGFIGSDTSRFTRFVRGPSAIREYLSGKWPVAAGHNPLGALSVLVLLASVLFQAVSGLFANDDILLEGPYASMVSKDLSDLITRLHHWNSNLLLGLIALHLAAIFFHLARGNNLIRPMLTGRRTLGVVQPTLASTGRAVLLLAIVAAVTWFVVTKAWK